MGSETVIVLVHGAYTGGGVLVANGRRRPAPQTPHAGHRSYSATVTNALAR